VRRNLLDRAVTFLVLLRDAAIAGIVIIVLSPLWLLPWRVAVRVGAWYGRIAYFGWPMGRHVAMINLRRAYGPELTRSQARRETAHVFGHLGRSVAEAIQFARRYKDGQPGWEETYRAEDPALERRLLADPRPKIFVTGHLGSWEVGTMLVGLRARQRGAAIARRVDNPFIDALVRRGRLRDGSQWIEKRGAGAEALARLREGHSIALLADESAGRRGVFVDFFGRPAATNKTPALLSLMTGNPIVLGATVRRHANPPLLVRLVALEPADYASLGPDAPRIMTQDIVRLWERWVREDPRQWRWVHWRWKHRPDGSEETYRRRDVERCFQQTAVQPGDPLRDAL
jgi:KDO2-lipid IV(A) lauroyltransferase